MVSDDDIAELEGGCAQVIAWAFLGLLTGIGIAATAIYFLW